MNEEKMLSDEELKIISGFASDGWSYQEIAQTILDIRNATIFKSLVFEIHDYLERKEK